MNRTHTALLLALGLGFVPSSAAGQFVIRDDVNGWGWLALRPVNPVVVMLAHGSPQNQSQGRLDDELMFALANQGIQRLRVSGQFDATVNQVLAECAVVHWTPPGTEQVQAGIHAEVSFWDHTRLAATEIYESLNMGTTEPGTASDEAFVAACTNQLAPVLFRLGFDQS